MRFKPTPTLLADFYKVSHREQYPYKTERVYATWTPRCSRIEGVDKVVAFGFQAFCKNYLIDYFDENFFEKPLEEVITEYKRMIKNTLIIDNPHTKHIEDLHNLGYLPIKIKAVKEGTRIPLRVPMLTIENTDDRFFWLTNFLETIMSSMLWMPSTSATIAFEYRQILEKWFKVTSGVKELIPFLGHDFSMRGMTGVESASASSAGHLLSFVGTDTIPAIQYLEAFYDANVEKELVGCSVPATEHSVMCAMGRDELSAFKRLITKIYSQGIVSVVSDTWDLWKIIGEILPALKSEIMDRDGKLVIRPDSGDPVKIICGDKNHKGLTHRDELIRKGVVECLYDIFGGEMNEKGFIQLDSHVGAIYGDAITRERCSEICKQLADKGFTCTNVIFGIGSYTYQYNTRDTFGFALKSTHVVIDGKEKMIFKDPKTDDGLKKSQKGRVAVCDYGCGIKYVDELNIIDQYKYEKVNLLENVFIDGNIVRNETLSEIRKRLLSSL